MTGNSLVPPGTEPGITPYSRDRTLALSDGVFAIAITLLVLEIVPAIPETVTGPALSRALLEMWPGLLAYLLSFLVIGRLWDSHRMFFGYIHRADGRVVWANLAVLLWVTLIPATAALLGSHWAEPTALSLYATNLILAVASLWALWQRAAGGGHLHREELHAQVDKYVNRYAAISVAGFALAIPAAFLSPPVALALVFLTAALARAIARRILASDAPSADPDQADEVA